MGFPIVINWVSPLSFLGASGVFFFFFNFIQFFDEISVCKQNSPRWDAAFCYSVCICPIKGTPGLYEFKFRYDRGSLPPYVCNIWTERRTYTTKHIVLLEMWDVAFTGQVI